jgi:hypothetical protein
MRNLKMESKAIELAELMASKAVIEAKIEAVRNEIIDFAKAEELTFFKLGKCSINIRKDKVWVYSKWVRTLEKMLKTRKDNEQKNGTATHSEKPTWRFVFEK